LWANCPWQLAVGEILAGTHPAVKERILLKGAADDDHGDEFA
jgi:hypothetical protein